MLFLKCSILILIINFSLFNIAYPFFKRENSNYIVFFGLLILLTFLSFGYFFFDINIFYLKIIFIILSLIFLIKNLKSKYFFNKYIQIFYLIIIPIIFYSLLLQLYGEQFFVFRGNHYDSLNYTSMSVMMMNYKNSEILSLIQYFSQNDSLEGMNLYLRNAIIYFDGRPLVSLFNSFFYYPEYLDLFEADFIFRIFLLTLVPIGTMKFVEIVNIGQNYVSKFIISQIFTLSFWTTYILEINANSQLAAFGLSIFFTSYILENYKLFINFNLKKNLIFSFTSAFFFIMYAEQASVYFIIIFIFLFIKNIKNFSNYKIYLSSIFFIIIFISLLIPHGYLLDFIIKQSEIGLKAKNDWWGYYGAFILGAKSIVNESYHVDNIKILWSDRNFFNILNYINIYNASEYGIFYWLNIIPSLFGFYYINAIYENNSIIQYIVFSLLNFVILFLFIKNLIQITKIKNNYNLLYKIVFIFSFLFALILIYNLSFWSVIKLYFYISIFIFIIIYRNFNLYLKNKENLIKVILLILILVMPLYKFSEFNNGIGKIDSFPSVIDVSMKKDYNWAFDPKKFKNCEIVYIKNYDKYINTILSSKLSYFDINNVKFLDNSENNNNNKCNIDIKNE